MDLVKVGLELGVGEPVDDATVLHDVIAIGDRRSEAKILLDQEYGEALLPWMEVPEDVTDAHEFAVRYAADRLNERG